MSFAYVGSELEVFAEAIHWKRYLQALVGPALRGHVLEVGAGIGGTTQVLCDGSQDRWLCLEPDARNAAELTARLPALPRCCEVAVGTTATLPPGETFDAIVYIDILEHLEDDTGELVRALARLRPGGRIVAVSPAHAWLFSPFDAAIGHVRRYALRELVAAAPPGLVLERAAYLDAAGLLASAGNRLLLRAAHPTAGQIRFWDRVLVPVSRVLDPLLGFRVGKSVLAVWRRPGR